MRRNHRFHLSYWWLRLRALLFRDRTEQDLHDELELHVELQTRKNLRLGLSESEARRRALLKFGGLTKVEEECRDVRQIGFIENLIHDARYAFRIFHRNALFTMVALLLLAVGIGATTTVFSLAYQVIQESLPVTQPEQLVELGYDDGVQHRFLTGFSHAGFQLFLKSNQVFSEMFAFSDVFKVSAVHDGVAESVDAVFQTTNMSSVLGLRPALGRLINDGDAQGSSETPRVVLSYRYWQRRFAGSPNVIGQTLPINNNVFVIAGVAPSEFQGMILGASPDLIMPLQVVDAVRQLPTLNNGSSLWLHVIGRRKPGVPLEHIRASLEPTYRAAIDHAVSSFPPAFAAGVRDNASKWQFQVRSAARGVDSETRIDLSQSLIVLLWLAGVIFLIGSTNLAGLLASRAEVRSKELTIRLAIGCSRGRLIRQMITESMLMAAMGGLASIAISVWARPVLLRLLTSRAAFIDIKTGFETPLMALTASVLSGFVLGIVPALAAWRVSNKTFTKELSTFKSNRGRVLIMTQVAASFVLLVLAAQFALSLKNYRNLLPGFRPDHLVLFEVRAGARSITYAREMRERLSQLPGVVSVTHSNSSIGQLAWTTPVEVPGFQPQSPGSNLTGRNIVGPRFAETLGLQLISGRDVEASDGRDAPSVVIVNESFVRHFLNGLDPIGRKFSFIDSMTRPHTIVGVVKDARDRGIKSEAGPVAYSSFEHDPLPNMTFTLKVEREPEQVMPEVASVARQVDPLVPINQLRTMDAQIDVSLLRERMLASLSSAFGALACVVAAIGIYGMLAFAVMRRSREIAVRIAVGAKPSEVRWLALRESMMLLGSGIAIGIPLSMVISWTVRSQLFGITSHDLEPIVIAVATLSLFAAAAAWLPARRASRIDPVAALRVE